MRRTLVPRSSLVLLVLLVLLVACARPVTPAETATASSGKRDVGTLPASDLFISEYFEGGSLDKAIEIYNGTGSSVDLTAGAYAIQVFSNGATTPSRTVALTGTVVAGDVFVVANPRAGGTIAFSRFARIGSGVGACVGRRLPGDLQPLPVGAPKREQLASALQGLHRVVEQRHPRAAQPLEGGRHVVGPERQVVHETVAVQVVGEAGDQLELGAAAWRREEGDRRTVRERGAIDDLEADVALVEADGTLEVGDADGDVMEA